MLQTTEKTLKILAVDDEELNLDILSEYFEGEKYNILKARDGLEAWEILGQDQSVDVVVLDRMMPKMDGLTLLKKMKQDVRFKTTPVIMQTAATSTDQVKEGIEAGAFYYLSKPYQKDILLSIVRSAGEDAHRYSSLLNQVSSNDNALNLVKEAIFEFRNLDDVKSLSFLIANCCPKDRNVLWGITELMLNAVEHGNLGITYNEKKKLLINGTWTDEVNIRLKKPENKNKVCILNFRKDNHEISISILDQGKGFSWEQYLEIDPTRITDPNGRGIALSKQISFDSLEYANQGRLVTCKIRLTSLSNSEIQHISQKQP